MYFNKEVNNPMLAGAIRVMKEENTVKSREIVLEEILKAEFLCPATVSMPPQPDENGELFLPDGCVITHKMVRDKKDRPLLLAFLNKEQMEKWKENRAVRDEVYGFAMNFTEYVQIMLQKQADGTYGPAEGFVIDPFGFDLVVDRDMVANLMLRVMLRDDPKQTKEKK